MSSAALTRLYALGLDAFRVAVAFKDGAPERFTLEGATGRSPSTAATSRERAASPCSATATCCPLKAAD
jgi:outer membrane PBP1 activator LpoA protein